MKLLRVPTVHFVYYRRIGDKRTWTYRCLVMATRQMWLVDLMENTLATCEGCVEVKIAQMMWRQSGIYVATFFFDTQKSAADWRTEHYENEFCAIAGPIKRTKPHGKHRTEVPPARPEADRMPEDPQGDASREWSLVAENEDMAVHLHRGAPHGLCYVG